MKKNFSFRIVKILMPLNKKQLNNESEARNLQAKFGASRAGFGAYITKLGLFE